MSLIRNAAKAGEKQAFSLKTRVEEGATGLVDSAANAPQGVLSWGRGSYERAVPLKGRMAAFTVYALSEEFLFYEQLADTPKAHVWPRPSISLAPNLNIPERRSLPPGVNALAISEGGHVNGGPGAANPFGEPEERWDFVVTPTAARSQYDEIFFSFLRSFGGLLPREGAELVMRRVRTTSPKSEQVLISEEFANYHLEHGLAETVNDSPEALALSREIQRRWEAHEIDCPPCFKMVDSTIDITRLPSQPVCLWSACPRCNGHLVLFDGMAECTECRRIWCDPGLEPILDDQSGAIVGHSMRIGGMADYEDSVFGRPAAYLRGPRRDAGSWPLPFS